MCVCLCVSVCVIVRVYVSVSVWLCVCEREIADIMSLSCQGSEHLDLIRLGNFRLGCVVLCWVRLGEVGFCCVTLS